MWCPCSSLYAGDVCKVPVPVQEDETLSAEPGHLDGGTK